jgi:hypothetical protein
MVESGVAIRAYIPGAASQGVHAVARDWYQSGLIMLRNRLRYLFHSLEMAP